MKQDKLLTFLQALPCYYPFLCKRTTELNFFIPIEPLFRMFSTAYIVNN